MAYSQAKCWDLLHCSSSKSSADPEGSERIIHWLGRLRRRRKRRTRRYQRNVNLCRPLVQLPGKRTGVTTGGNAEILAPIIIRALAALLLQEAVLKWHGMDVRGYLEPDPRVIVTRPRVP